MPATGSRPSLSVFPLASLSVMILCKMSPLRVSKIVFIGCNISFLPNSAFSEGLAKDWISLLSLPFTLHLPHLEYSQQQKRAGIASSWNSQRKTLVFLTSQLCYRCCSDVQFCALGQVSRNCYPSGLLLACHLLAC